MMLTNTDRFCSPEKTLNNIQKFNLKRKQDSLTKIQSSDDVRPRICLSKLVPTRFIGSSRILDYLIPKNNIEMILNYSCNL